MKNFLRIFLPIVAGGVVLDFCLENPGVVAFILVLFSVAFCLAALAYVVNWLYGPFGLNGPMGAPGEPGECKCECVSKAKAEIKGASTIRKG